MKITSKASLCAILVASLFSLSAFAESVTIKVKGMMCDSCAEAVTTKLTSNPGVESVSVKVSKGIVEVVLKPGAAVNDESIKTLIADAGYAATEIERKS